MEESEGSEFGRSNVNVYIHCLVNDHRIRPLLSWLNSIAIAFPAGGRASIALWFRLIAFDSSDLASHTSRADLGLAGALLFLLNFSDTVVSVVRRTFAA
jgi:hypothetical protein